MDIVAEFEQGFQEYGWLFTQLGVTPEQKKLMLEFAQRVWQVNQDINIVSRKMTPRDMVERQFLDSLLALPFLPKAQKIADLGTGGGFPAVLLAICRPETHFVLFEKSVLKRRYLDGLPYPNLEVRALIEPGALDQNTDLVVSRAFKPIKPTLDLSRDYLKRGGRYMFYKARRSVIDEELAACGKQDQKRWKIDVQVLETHGLADERHLVWIQAKSKS